MIMFKKGSHLMTSLNLYFKKTIQIPLGILTTLAMLSTPF